MNQDDDGRLVQIVEFTVRNDKYRGITIEKIATDNDEYFFKYQDQSIHRHCEQVKQIILDADVKRTKKILIDVAPFRHEYYFNGKIMFKGIALNSVNQQMRNKSDMMINKEIGAMKRSVTVTQNKGRKIHERNSMILKKMEDAELYYQEERAKRIKQLFGVKDPKAPQNPRGPKAAQENRDEMGDITDIVEEDADL